MSDFQELSTSKSVGVRDIPLIVFAPRRLFARVEDVGSYGWPLLILLTAVTMIGYAIVETGLIDYAVDTKVVQRIAQMELVQRDVVERSARREMYEREAKAGEFEKLITRIKVVAAEPARTLATTLIVASVLYGVVALTGRKAEWHTLMTICVYAGFIDLLRLLMQLAMMLRFSSLDVSTSLAPLARLITPAGPQDLSRITVIEQALTAADPFRIWFWLAILIGLAATAQLRGWRAWLTVVLCWLAGTAIRCGLAAAMMPQAPGTVVQ